MKVRVVIFAALLFAFAGCGRPVPTNAVEAFAKATRAKDYAAARALLPPVPDYDRTVSEREAEAIWADHFLRQELTVSDVRPGEPGEGGRWKKSARFTLTTKVSGTTPKLTVREADGRTSPARMSLLNPDIVVEVRDGKLVATRAESHTE